MEADDDQPGRVDRLIGDEVERARVGAAQRTAQVWQGPLQEGQVGHAAGEAIAFGRRPEARTHEDGVEAIGVPGDAYRTVVLEHRFMVGASGPGRPAQAMHGCRTGGARCTRGTMLVVMFEERPDIQERLDSEIVAWMTTVSPSGQPQTSPVWFLVSDETFVIYSLSGTPRTRNIVGNPRVCLNLNSTPDGGDLVIIEGLAELVPDGPAANEDEAYVAKFRGPMADLSMTPESFAVDYPVRIHVRPTRLRAS